MAGQQASQRPRRSVLYVPASNPKALEKAQGLACDGVIVDLEDSVAPEAKPAAREAALEAVRRGFGGREVAVRCNGLDTPWGEADLQALAQAGPDAVLVPKIRSATDIARSQTALAPAPERTRIWAMIETPEAVLDLSGIAASAVASRLSGLVYGPNDLAAELRLKPAFAGAALRPVLTRLVMAARAHGLIALGGVFTGLEDHAAFEAECREEAGFGFDGKTLVHPSQIEPANRIFSPSPEEIAWARKVTAAFAAPEAAGKGVLRLEGRMIEHLHLREAERVLALAEAVG
jgi:citrate lyase subunit beta/citryl-CoA lyase